MVIVISAFIALDDCRRALRRFIFLAPREIFSNSISSISFIYFTGRFALMARMWRLSIRKSLLQHKIESGVLPRRYWVALKYHYYSTSIDFIIVSINSANIDKKIHFAHLRRRAASPVSIKMCTPTVFLHFIKYWYLMCECLYFTRRIYRAHVCLSRGIIKWRQGFKILNWHR